MNRPPSLLKDLLLAAVHADSDDSDLRALVDAVGTWGGVPDLVEVARAHGVSALIYSRLTAADGDPSGLIDDLARDHAAALALDRHAVRTVRRVLDVVDRPVLVVKGPALARWYEAPAVRLYSDVDLLTRRVDFTAVLAALVATGFAHASTNWAGFLAHEVGELPLVHRVSTVDLHWDMLATGSLRRQFALSSEAMVERAEETALAETSVLTLDQVDTLLHLCVGAGLDGGRRLLQLVDVDRLVRHGTTNWPQFADRVDQSQTRALCSAVLARCVRVLGTPVPADVLRQLAPYTGWAELNSLVGERRVRARRLVGGLASGFVMSSGRDTRRATVSAAIKSAGETVRIRLGGHPLTGPGGALDWQAASPGGMLDRERYLEWVETA